MFSLKDELRRPTSAHVGWSAIRHPVFPETGYNLSNTANVLTTIKNCRDHQPVPDWRKTDALESLEPQNYILSPSTRSRGCTKIKKNLTKIHQTGAF